MLSHASPLPKRFGKSYDAVRATIYPCLVALFIALFFPSAAHGQGGVPLVTVATDQSQLNLSNQFGVPASSAINQAGDFAFVGNGGTALFFRAASASSATRLLQIDDEIPGLPGRKIAAIFPQLGINSSRTLFFGVVFDGASDSLGSALLTYDGTTFHTVVTSEDIAPGSGNAAYGPFLVPGSINDGGDVNFAAVPVGKSALTYYILAAAAPTAKRIAALDDPPPPECTWCVASTSLENFFAGSPTTSLLLTGSQKVFALPGLNAQGEMLLSLWGGLFIGSKDKAGITLVPLAAPPGACSPSTTTTGTSTTSILIRASQGFLNNGGDVAFTGTSTSGSGSAICIVPAGASSPIPAVQTGDAAPTALGTGTLTSPFALGMNDSGDIIFGSGILGSNVTTTFALLRYHKSNGQPVSSDVVAYNCEAAPNRTGSTFSPFPPNVPCDTAGVSILLPLSAFNGISMANDGRISFRGSLSGGGSGIYRQTGAFTAANPPELIFFDAQTAGTLFNSIGAQFIETTTFSFLPFTTKILDSGSVFFSTFLTGGAADFAEYFGAPGAGNLRSLMSTADSLPAGARTILERTAPAAAGHFVAFTAQPAAGRVNLLVSDLAQGTITRVVSDNDPALAAAGGPAGSTVLAPNFFLNENGQVAFETVGTSANLGGSGFIIFGPGSVNSAWLGSGASCGTIFLWSPPNVLAKVASAGDPVQTSSSTSPKFYCVGLNDAAPSPLNQLGQVAFNSSSPFQSLLPCFLCGGVINPGLGVDGVFLYTPGTTGGTISEIAAANDTLPGEPQSLAFVPQISVPVNSSGQVAFGAQEGSPGFQGFFLRKGDTLQKIVSSGDAVPSRTDTFGFPHFISGLTGLGDLAFTSATSTAAEGLFLAPAAGGPIAALAIDGGPIPGSSGGSTFSLAPNFILPPLTPVIFFGGNSFTNFAAINDESDVAFGAALGGTGANSGYFRAMHGVASGALQSVVLQGQAAPGGGTFGTIPVLNPGGGATFALGPDGAFSFVNTFTDSAGTKRGLFVARPDGSLVRALATGDFVPVPGGGISTGLGMRKLSAGEAGKFAFLTAIQGGSARRAIFVTEIPSGLVGTTATLNTSQALPLALQPTPFTAAVTSLTGPTPTGTVNFFDSGISLGPPVTLSAGQAVTTTSSLAGGSHSIIAQYGGDSTFAPTNSPALTLVVTGFGPSPAGLAVKAGLSITIPLMLYAANANQSFALSCSGLPAKSSCAFDQNSVTPGPSGASIKVTLSTMGNSKLPPDRSPKGPGPLGFLRLMAIASALLALGWIRLGKALECRLAYGACLAVLAVAIAMAGCGAVGSGSSLGPSVSGTPAGPATITVTAVSGTTTVSTAVSVTVQ